MWNGFDEEIFNFKDRRAHVIFPKVIPNGKAILKTEYLDAFPEFEIEMLSKGYILCHVEHESRWAPDGETILMAEFIQFVSEKYTTSSKFILVGLSCGGLQAVRLAEMYPSLVSAMYLDAPVLNILSMAGLGECRHACLPGMWRELVATYGFSRSTIVNFRNSPIDHLETLIEHKIPVILLYGNSDEVVIYEENGKVLEEFYKNHGGIIKVICRSMSGHHPHGLEDLSPIINFVEKYS